MMICVGRFCQALTLPALPALEAPRRTKIAPTSVVARKENTITVYIFLRFSNSFLNRFFFSTLTRMYTGHQS